MDVAGTAAIVTGGSSGLGAATARAFASAGAKVALLDLDKEKGESAAREIGGAFVPCDVANDESAARAIATARDLHGPARILVNCAGIGRAARIVGREGPAPLADFETVVRINLTGTFNMMRLAASYMTPLEPLETGERGIIVSTASIAAFEGQIGQAAYAASKGGIAALTLPAARELARFGIRVLAVAPGLFRTPLLGQLPPEVQETLGGSIPFPARLGNPDEFADLVLAMVRNPYLNGEVIRLDGALRMPPR
jgi:NAD(P)-dependent dehydrogenase (short-subunit alcohol dehydrogenase family)